jgi:hypothetical protein
MSNAYVTTLYMVKDSLGRKTGVYRATLYADDERTMREWMTMLDVRLMDQDEWVKSLTCPISPFQQKMALEMGATLRNIKDHKAITRWMKNQKGRAR